MKERVMPPVEHFSDRLTQILDPLFAHLEVMAGLLAEIPRDDPDEVDRRFAAFEEFVRTTLTEDRTPVVGMGFIGDSNAMAQNTVHWWYLPVEGERSPRPLSVRTEPDAIDFYDAPAMEWWEGAASQSGLYTSGPYVDLGGTNAYIVSLSLAVTTAGAVLGVVAIDIAVGVLQTRLQNALLDLPRPSSLADQHGMVIATNSGRLLGGVVDVNDGQSAVAPNVGGTSWSLVAGNASND